jgi:phospholipase C
MRLATRWCAIVIDRRSLLKGAGAGLVGASSIARALAIDADVRHGTLMDVEHVVILMQENRGFDHYFGSMAGVRGFGDRFPIPSVGGGTVWTQMQNGAAVIPFHLDTTAQFAMMCAQGTPHTWPDAQAAWDEGRMSRWPEAKSVRAMGHYQAPDLPFQYALAEAFTLCDAYHCSLQTGTNTNRLFLWSGTNDPSGAHGGPAIGNSHDSFVKDGGWPEGYRWTTYVERLQAAGIDWRIYQDMADNFSDNPLAGFQRFRDAVAAGPGGPDHDLVLRGLTTRKLDRLRADVLAGSLPQVSWIVSDAASSEHPAASSPAQGADYTAQVLSALTADPAVWARTVLLVMFDENDGYFDHMPPPAPPSRGAGASTISTEGEYHLVHSAADAASERPELIGRPYGLGPRVPMDVISPRSRGGWVNGQVFDHSSVIRFLERRFGIAEPNISPWRRAVCGDLTSAFDFRRPNRQLPGSMPETASVAARAKALPGRPPAVPPPNPTLPVQARGVRRSRALPYTLEVDAAATDRAVALRFVNGGTAAAVLHVYDRLNRERTPRRYTVGAGAEITGRWECDVDAGLYDLWVLGPNGFHRHFTGVMQASALQATLRGDAGRNAIILSLHNAGVLPCRADVTPTAYPEALAGKSWTIAPGQSVGTHWSLARSSSWYDLQRKVAGEHAMLRRFAGRLESGRDGISDPAMGGAALSRHPV